jgi:hypothetical protein
MNREENFFESNDQKTGDYYSGNQKSSGNSLFLIFALVFLAGAVALGLLYFNEKNEFAKAKTEHLNKVEGLEAQINEISSERGKLTEQLGIKDAELIEKDRIIGEKEKIISSLIYKGKMYDALKRELRELKVLNAEYLAKIDSLLKANKDLVALRESNAATIAQLAQQNNDLSLTGDGTNPADPPSTSGVNPEPSAASGNFSISKLELQILDDKESPVEKYKKIKSFKLFYNIEEKVPTNEPKDIKLAFALKNEVGDVLPTDGKKKGEPSQIPVIGGKTIPVTLDYNFKYRTGRRSNFPNYTLDGYKLKKGVYTYEVYISENNKEFIEKPVATGTIELN